MTYIGTIALKYNNISVVSMIRNIEISKPRGLENKKQKN